MDALAERGHAAMLWLLVVGLVAAWAALDRPPPVVDTAVSVVDRILLHPERLGIEGDPLAALPPSVHKPLAQYRHLFLHPALEYDRGLLPSKRAELEQITLGGILLLAEQARTSASQSGVTDALFAAPLRADIAKLDLWQHKSGLSGSASAHEVRRELSARVQIPGTEQAVPLSVCMFVLGLGIVGLQLYVVSHLRTMCELAASGDASRPRSWVVLHGAPLGPLLTTLWLALPPAAWIVHEVLLPLREEGRTPSLGVWFMAALALATTIAALRQARHTRGVLLGNVPSVVSIVAEQRSRAA
jgi:hypothetical protein